MTVEKLAVYALTAPGAVLGFTLKNALSGFGPAVLFLPQRLAEMVPEDEADISLFGSLKEALHDNFVKYHGHIIIGATGMVVRLIAPLLNSKVADPAVLTLGQDGRYVISLLSGHLGGANRLACEVARLTGGQAVINTATDIEGQPAVEVLARDYDLEVENYENLPQISRILVEGGKVSVYDPGRHFSPHLSLWPDSFEILAHRPTSDPGPIIWVDYRTNDIPAQALILRPKILALGLGCHRGISSALVENLIKDIFKKENLSLLSIGLLASVETRRSEPAFLELSRRLKRPLLIYTKNELAAVETPTPSEVVQKQIGVPSVCEAAALLAARTGQLLIQKQKGDKTTLAAALIS